MLKPAIEVYKHLLLDFIAVVQERYSRGAYDAPREEIETWVNRDVEHFKGRLSTYKLPVPVVKLDWVLSGDGEILIAEMEYNEEQTAEILGKKVEWSRW